MLSSYRLRWARRRLLYRAWASRRNLTNIADRSAGLPANAIFAFVTLRNERIRLPYFLRYYRDLGINHFFMVDNGSTDGSLEYLKDQPDVSLWRTEASYKKSRFGMDWISHLLRRYGHGHWCLTVDPDEFFVYPFCETRPIRALTDWLDTTQIRTFSAMLLDMYPKGPITDQAYREGQDPFEIAQWFDSGNYQISRNAAFGNLWIQGGPTNPDLLWRRPKERARSQQDPAGQMAQILCLYQLDPYDAATRP